MVYADMSNGGSYPCCRHCLPHDPPSNHMLPCYLCNQIMSPAGWLQGIKTGRACPGCVDTDYGLVCQASLGGSCPDVSEDSPFTERTIPMARYRITIDNLENVADEPTITVIECTTNYTLREDLAEWVTEEIDPEAEIDHDQPQSKPCPECGSLLAYSHSEGCSHG